MAWMQEHELFAYAPTVERRSEVVILVAQGAVINYLGFDLELSQRVEILNLTNKTSTTQLSYHPIADSPAPVIEVREGNITDSFKREVPLTEWNTLQTGDYVLDSTGLLSLNISDTSLTFKRTFGKVNQVRATYAAGLDFAAETTEIKLLKTALGQIISYQESSFYQQGIQEIDIDGFHQVRYATSNTGQSGQVPEPFLKPFSRYASRGGLMFS